MTSGVYCYSPDLRYPLTMKGNFVRVNKDTSPTPISKYLAWQKAIREDETLRKLAGMGLRRKPADIRTTALFLATYGTCGAHCYPTTEKLAGVTGFSRDTISEHLKTLVSLGWFTAEPAHRKPTDYSIANPVVSDPHPTLANPVVSDLNPTLNVLVSDEAPVLVSDVDPTPPRTYNQDHKDQDQKRLRRDQEHKKLVSDLNPTQENRYPVPDRDEAAGPWCTSCDVPLTSGLDKEHNENENHWDYFRCTACGADKRIEFSFSDKGKPQYRCKSCGGYLYLVNGKLTADNKTHRK